MTDPTGTVQLTHKLKKNVKERLQAFKQNGHVICTDKLWCLLPSRSLIVKSESLQHHVGGSTGSTVSPAEKVLWLGGPVHWSPEQKPFTSTWQPLPVLKSIVRA